MKNKWIKAAGLLLTAGLILGGLKYLTDITQRKDSDYKYGPFFAEKNDFDVLFLGTSHVMNGIFPMELWNDYGITSYNFGGHDNYLPTSYWVLKNALDYTSPEVVVIDCLTLRKETKTSDNISYVHQSLDAFPLSLNKFRAVQDLIAPECRPEFLWDFIAYHSRWEELEEQDFSPVYTLEKGAESRIAVGVPQYYEKADRSEKTADGTVTSIYLRNMIQECKDRGIQVLLTFLPFPADKDRQMEANLAYDIAAECQVPYLNFLDMEKIIDYAIDCYDANSHLNPSGARKVTSYLGAYLQEQYALTDHREDPSYAQWNADYDAYMDFKLQNLSASDNVFTYLMLLYDPNLGFDIRINRDSPLLENHVFQHLIQNPGTFTSTETDDGQISFSNLSDSDIWNDITEMKDGDVQIAVKDLRREILADYAAFSSDGQ
ncbi:MAG: hypothetical protein MRZ74_13340 [Blautia sp.]|nr:hypothetical protein [Blautia sp.]